MPGTTSPLGVQRSKARHAEGYRAQQRSTAALSQRRRSERVLARKRLRDTAAHTLFRNGVGGDDSNAKS